MAWDVSDDPVDFDEAVEWFKDKLALSKEVWETLTQQAKARAFTVAGVAQLDVVTQVWEAIDDAVASGTTLEDFKAAVGDALEAAWAGTVDDPAWRLETIFRTNVQSAYGVGRYEQATDEAVLADRPVWMFDAILDGRETPICRACDGTKLPANDAWWRTRVPPLHFNCRSTIVTLTEQEAGKITLVKPKAKPQQGFGAAPSYDDEPWTPDMAEYPKELAPLYAEKNE